MRLRRSLHTLLLLFAATLLACDDGSADPDAGPPRDAAGGDPDFVETEGRFRVVEGVFRSEEGDRPYGQVTGAILDHSGSFHTETLREGACRLLEFEVAQCEPYCDGICVDTNVCEPWPTWRSAGTITLHGLELPMSLTPSGPGNWYDPSTFPIPTDLFAPGAAITATAAGAEVVGFTVAAVGVHDLDPGFSGLNLTLANGADNTVTWTAADPSTRVRLTLASPNQAHGLPYDAIIECDGPDSGALTIPRAIVEAFPETSGQAICVSIDCPYSSFARYTRGLTQAGDVEIALEVASQIDFGVIHAGL